MKPDLTISRANVAQVKARLSQYLRRVKDGETVIVCERGVPIAALGPIAEEPRRRVIHDVHPDWDIPDSFFDPLPEDIFAAFEGRDERADDPLRSFKEPPQ